jgi:hypothetical protein
MKKYLLFLALLIVPYILSSQTVLKYGLKVGSSGKSTLIEIDSISSWNGTDIRFYKAGTLLGHYNMQIIPIKDQYRIGISTAPVEGDSILTNADYIGKTLDVWREGDYQYLNVAVNVTDGYRFNSGTGQLIFRPVFGDREQIIIKYY